MGPTWVLSAPDGPHVGLMKLAIRGRLQHEEYFISASMLSWKTAFSKYKIIFTILERVKAESMVNGSKLYSDRVKTIWETTKSVYDTHNIKISDMLLLKNYFHMWITM